MNRTLLAACAAVAAVWACSSNDASGPVGGPVTGPANLRCVAADGGSIAQATNPASCHPAGSDGGVVADYGDTLFNTEGEDDDCKYHVKFTSTPVRANADVTFTVVATNRADGGPAGNGATYTETYLSATHPAPNSNVHTTENPPGTYTIGPVRFDSGGRWTVRFHLYGDCDDTAKDSPHGHAAFFIDVP